MKLLQNRRLALQTQAKAKEAAEAAAAAAKAAMNAAKAATGAAPKTGRPIPGQPQEDEAEKRARTTMGVNRDVPWNHSPLSLISASTRRASPSPEVCASCAALSLKRHGLPSTITPCTHLHVSTKRVRHHVSVARDPSEEAAKLTMYQDTAAWAKDRWQTADGLSDARKYRRLTRAQAKALEQRRAACAAVMAQWKHVAQKRAQERAAAELAAPRSIARQQVRESRQQRQRVLDVLVQGQLATCAKLVAETEACAEEVNCAYTQLRLRTMALRSFDAREGRRQAHEA